MKCGIIVTHFNPCGYRRPAENLRWFTPNIIGQCPGFMLVRADFREWERDDKHLGQVNIGIIAAEQNMLWQKERLINLAIQQLPPEYDAVAWIDGDLLFDNPDWYAATCDMLETVPVLQLFETISYLGKEGNVVARNYGAVAAGDRLTFKAPGGAIACRRELLEHGLYDRNVMGGGDQVFLGACNGTHFSFWKRCNPKWGESVRAWCERFGTHDVGFVPGNVNHLWHGSRRNRQLKTRHEVLSALDYDPENDVTVGANGLLEWASDKPALHQAVREYFEARLEDE